MSATYFGDLKNSATIQHLAALSAQSTTSVGTGVDFGLGDGNNTVAIASVISYDIASGNETYALLIEESADDVTYTSVAGLDGASFTSKTSAGGDPGTSYVQVINFFRSKRYLRVTLTVGGTTPSWTGTVIAMEPLKISGSGGGYQA